MGAVWMRVYRNMSIIERFDFEEGSVLLPDEFNECLVAKDYHTGRPVYCIERIISHLMQSKGECKDNMENALDHFDHNIANIRSDGEPIWIWMGEDYE